jgi:hypothetical protein
MYHTQQSEIVIDGTPEEIWEFSSNPENWTASNPTEHWGLTYDSPDNRPGEGVEFHQDEAVAGIRNDLYGRFQYLDVPNVAVWTGSAYYPLLGGLLTIRIPEGGTIRLEETEDGRTRMSHAIFMDFPNSRFGRWFKWVFVHVIDGPEKLAQHNRVELEYFKEHVESPQARDRVPA